MLKNFLESRRSLKALDRIAAALERIARVGEESILAGSNRSPGLRSWYNGNDPEAGTVIMQTDEEFAEFEFEDRKRGKGTPVSAEPEPLEEPLDE